MRMATVEPRVRRQILMSDKFSKVHDLGPGHVDVCTDLQGTITQIRAVATTETLLFTLMFKA